MADDHLVLRLDRQTFADDSFKVYDSRGIVVVGQLPQWVGFSWHRDLVKQFGTELKWAKVRNRWRDLSSDLRKAVVRDLREALISIVDPSLYRFELTNDIVNAVGRPETAWPEPFRQWAQTHVSKWETERVVMDSPASRIERYLAMPDILDVDQDYQSDTVLSNFTDAFEKPHNARLFGARSAAAFAHLLDRDAWHSVADEMMEDRRYLTPGHVGRQILAAGERTQRVFDEGNEPSVLAINDLKSSIRTTLNDRGLIVLTDGPLPLGAIEQVSADVAMLQAADLAAGYARELYGGSEGLRHVCEEFKGVILNGSMVRDWTQVERLDLEKLRTA